MPADRVDTIATLPESTEIRGAAAGDGVELAQAVNTTVMNAVRNSRNAQVVSLVSTRIGMKWLTQCKGAGTESP